MVSAWIHAVTCHSIDNLNLLKLKLTVHEVFAPDIEVLEEPTACVICPTYRTCCGFYT